MLVFYNAVVGSPVGYEAQEEQVVQANKGSGWVMLALPELGLTVRYRRPVLGSV